jgi:hypothetical protein
MNTPNRVGEESLTIHYAISSTQQEIETYFEITFLLKIRHFLP